MSGDRAIISYGFDGSSPTIATAVVEGITWDLKFIRIAAYIPVTSPTAVPEPSPVVGLLTSVRRPLAASSAWRRVPLPPALATSCLTPEDSRDAASNALPYPRAAAFMPRCADRILSTRGVAVVIACGAPLEARPPPAATEASRPAPAPPPHPSAVPCS